MRTIAWDGCSFATLGGVCRADGDSHDNALAESFNGLYKAESIHQRPWRGLDDVEYETLEYLGWFNQRRLHGEIGMVPPAEFEAAYYHQSPPVAMAGTQ